MGLITVQELKEYIGTSGTTRESLLEAVLDAAEREILNFCHRSSDWTGFEASTGTRYYRAEDIVDLPYGSQYGLYSQTRKSWDQWPGASYSANAHTALWLGDADLQSVDSLTNGDDSTINSTSYRLYPRNKKPYRYIELLSDESWSFNTDGEVAVAGTWGYSTGPDATIKNCVKEMAKYLLDARQNQVWDVTAQPDAGIITVPKGMPKHVEVALRKGGYVRSLGVY